MQSHRQLSRRHMSAALLAGMVMPFGGRALGQTVDDIRRAIHGMGQLHSLQIQLGDDVVPAITSNPGRPARSEGYFGALMALLDGPVLALG